MRQFRTLRGLYVIGSGLALLVVVLIPNEVEEEVSSAHQVLFEAIVGDDPSSVAGKLRAEQALCPRRIDENTVLKSITLWKLNRVKYLYEVNESGRPRLVDWGYKGDVRGEIIERMKKSHLGPCVVNNGLLMDHVFEDTDGMSLLGVQLDKVHLRQLVFEEPPTPEEITRPEPSPTEEADREAYAALLKAEQEKCPVEISEHVTLEEIERVGKNRIKYHYRVPHPKYVSMNNQEEVEAEIKARMDASPLAPSIKNFDIQVQHFYRDAKNNCTLWLKMTRQDFWPTEFVATDESESEQAEAAIDAVASADTDELTEPEPAGPGKPWLPQEFKPIQRSLKNPAGIQLNPYAQ